MSARTDDTSGASAADAVTAAADRFRHFLDSRPAPDLSDSIMRQVMAMDNQRPSSHGWLHATVTALWAPRQLVVRPAFVTLALLACLVGGLAAGRLWTYHAGGATSPSSAVLVQFRFDTQASSVKLAGSFTGWEPRYDLLESAPGVWTITVPLPEGVHDYAFVVDGQRWVTDPYAIHIDDGFGGNNSRLAVQSAAHRAL